MKNKSKLRRQREINRQRKLRKAVAAPKRMVLRGRITVTAGGLGFVTPLGADAGSKAKAQDIFIPPQYLGAAMNGDVVEVELLPDRNPPPAGKDRGPAGRVREVIDRARETVVGELLAGHRIRALNKHITEEIKISGSLNGARRGEWVEVKLLHSDAARGGGIHRAALVDRISTAGSVKGDLDAVCREFDLAPPYTEAENEAASRLEPRPIERLDLRDRMTVTIDPFDAKDFDDAVSVAPTDNEDEVELGVHIADVAAWIVPGSEWDKAAYERAFTSYLPGRTLPMLPKSLTAKISLTTAGDSLAHTILFTVNRHSGRIVAARRGHSLIKVDKRLNYDEVQTYIDENRRGDDWDDKLCRTLDTLLKLYRNMHRLRQKNEDFLLMAIPETRVLCNEDEDKIIGIVRKVQREADQLIEECMLAANTQVAVELEREAIPGIFRVHPEPDPEKLAEFSEIALETFGIYPGDLSNRAVCNRFLKSLPDDPRRPAILNAFLRSLARAFYQEEPGLHFGLGKTRYSHFTSPIRRYPDLLVHQQLWEKEIAGGKLRSATVTAKIAEHCSGKEENSDEAYFTINDRLKLRYLEQEMANGRENLHEAVVSRIVTNGMLVDVEDLGIYGFVPLENLGGDFRRDGNRLIDRAGSQNFKCGDYVMLALSHIDLERGSAVFKVLDNREL
ncbi:MAG: ribonuclease R [Victivallaceae bacterium]|nr:ribonuclease R [Victivallaceae bacterium]